MAVTEEQIIDRILEAEGGYVDHPEDKGGPTNMGITLPTLDAFRGGRVVHTSQDLKDLTETEAREIYRDLYIRRPGFHLILNDPLRMLLIDSGVLFGVYRAAKWLQEALEVTPDGVIGKGTLDVLADTSPKRIYYKVCAMRCRRHGQRITADPKQAAFAAGWMNRLAAFIEGDA